MTTVRGGSTSIRPEEHRYLGTVLRWVPDAGCGLITSQGAPAETWYVLAEDLPDEARSLAVGTLVHFTGLPVPASGSLWPHAESVTLTTQEEQQ